MPVEPPRSPWSLRFPDPWTADRHGIVGAGADLEAGTILAAYRRGLFPMPLDRDGLLGWWSPDPRGILPLDGLRVSRSLRRSCQRYEVRVDTSFREVIQACAAPERAGGWITPEIRLAYEEMHGLGWAHSVETWHDGELVGGLYGVAIGGFFAGESMFHRRTDASKVALVGLVDLLAADGDPRRLLDVQWRTEHLATLGVVEVPRRRYLALLEQALDAPLPEPWR
ncbi:MAG TPA: leucyl/phenylalanyl-tRNA--protein transferase [Acidimicrobiales bacterium]|nr:leucyl/phenylalanyl-tRNA--protein transferase [Acidimicrobiales bacterium]